VKAVRVLFVALLLLVAAIVALGFMLPKHAHVERSISTTASPAEVYAVVDGFRRFNEWSPWAHLDPATRYTYLGPPNGVGARMEWQSEDAEVGSGGQEIVAVEPGRSVTSTLEFGAGPPAITRLTLLPEGGGTRIVWTMHASFEDNFVGRYFGPFLGWMVGPDYERGLRQLKRLVEVTPPADAPPISDPAAEPGPDAENAP
jgi:uncharacterized protein YndB with AHSA1/START domain